MALAVAAVAAVTNGETPLNVLQLLWVNLIMDAMAALGKTALFCYMPWAAALVHMLGTDIAAAVMLAVQ